MYILKGKVQVKFISFKHFVRALFHRNKFCHSVIEASSFATRHLEKLFRCCEKGWQRRALPEVTCVILLNDKERVVVSLGCSLEAHWGWDCVMLSPGEWGRRTSLRAGPLLPEQGHPSRVIQGPFTWLCWAGEGPVAGCTTTKCRCYLPWASLCSQTEGDDFWSYALLPSVCSEIMGEQDAPRWCVRLSSWGGESRIFTSRWAYPIHGVWNWGVSFWSAARVLSCKRSALEAILHLGLRNTYLGFRDVGCKRKNCMWVNPSSHVTVRAIKGFVLYVSKAHLQVSIPHSRLSPDIMAVRSHLDVSSSSRQREPHLAAEHQSQLTRHALKILTQYELYVSII